MKILAIKGYGGFYGDRFINLMNTCMISMPRDSMGEAIYLGTYNRFMNIDEFLAIVNQLAYSGKTYEAGKISVKDLTINTINRFFEYGMVLLGEGETKEDAIDDLLNKCSFRGYYIKAYDKDGTLIKNLENNPHFEYVCHPERLNEVDKKIYDYINERENTYSKGSEAAIHNLYEKTYITIESLQEAFKELSKSQIYNSIISLKEKSCINLQDKIPQFKVKNANDIREETIDFLN